MGSVSRPLQWELRLASVDFTRYRVQYEKLDLNDAQATKASSAVSATQLAAYCEAVKRLIAQGVEETQAVCVLTQCGGDLDAAELWIGVCSSVGLINLSDSSEAWAWEDSLGCLQLATNLQEVVSKMKAMDPGGQLSAVASLIETTSSAVTAEMQHEVAQLELARQQSEQSQDSGLFAEGILAHLGTSPGISRSKVVAIEEVLNPALWGSYSKQKNSMAEPNERWLFHGSGPENIAQICMEGFDLRLANPNGAYGSGIYFATNSLMSQGFTRKDPLKAMTNHHQPQSDLLNNARSHGLQVMLLCTVLLGHTGIGQPGRTQAPEGFDSVGGSTMQVIYKSEQAYPRYIIFLRP